MGATDLNVLSQAGKPYNAEPSSLVELTNHSITPFRLAYKRNHSAIIDLRSDSDLETYTVKVDGTTNGITPLDLTFKQVRDLPRKEVTAVLVCAGNRRAKMAQKTGRKVEGINWSEGTIANVRWAGAPLREILLRAGVADDRASWKNLHACFSSSIAPCEDDDSYGGSIPLERAMSEDADVLLAYEMNDEPLTPDHGFPLRVVVPGYGGMRWVKWVDHITISREESSNFYQQRDYKILPDCVTSKRMAAEGDWWSQVPSMENLPCNSVVTSVKRSQSSCPEEVPLTARGYAYSDCPIKCVEVSVDRGTTWQECNITYRDGQWSWALWEVCVDLTLDENVDATQWEAAPGKINVTVLSRATDSNGRVQPLTCPWNLRGVGYDAAGEAVAKV